MEGRGGAGVYAVGEEGAGEECVDFAFEGGRGGGSGLCGVC